MMGKSKQLSQDIRKKIVELHKSGSSLGSISKQLSVPRASVQTVVYKYKNFGTTLTLPRSGRRHKLSPKDEKTLVQKVHLDPKMTTKKLADELEASGIKVCISTIRRVLHRHGLKYLRKRPETDMEKPQ